MNDGSNFCQFPHSYYCDTNSATVLSVVCTNLPFPGLPLLSDCPVLGLLFQGCKQNDGQVTSLEGITVKTERKIKEKWQQSGEGKSWQKQRGPEKPGSCHLQYNQENTATNMSSENTVFNLAAVCSIKKNTNKIIRKDMRQKNTSR